MIPPTKVDKVSRRLVITVCFLVRNVPAIKRPKGILCKPIPTHNKYHALIEEVAVTKRVIPSIIL